MRLRYTTYILLIAACFATADCHAQTLSKLVEQGDKSFDAGEYYSASLYYRDAIKKSVDDAELNFKLAESCRLFNDYAGAAEAYRNTIKLDGPGKYPLAQFWLGEMLRAACVCNTADALK
jgi:Flp pilus assembly protein TadD